MRQAAPRTATATSQTRFPSSTRCTSRRRRARRRAWAQSDQACLISWPGPSMTVRGAAAAAIWHPRHAASPAWAALGPMPREDAMSAYIDTVKSFGATPPGEEPAQAPEAAGTGDDATDGDQRQSTRLTLENGVATLRLNRPARMNAFDFHMYTEVVDTLHAMGQDPVRAAGRPITRPRPRPADASLSLHPTALRCCRWGPVQACRVLVLTGTGDYYSSASPLPSPSCPYSTAGTLRARESRRPRSHAPIHRRQRPCQLRQHSARRTRQAGRRQRGDAGVVRRRIHIVSQAPYRRHQRAERRHCQCVSSPLIVAAAAVTGGSRVST